MTIIRQVLELARWAPSGDNTQPWRFEITSDSSALVHAFDTRDHCVYDLDGCASRLSHGALLETIALASTRFGCRSIDAVVDEDALGNVTYSVQLEPATRVAEDPLVPFIEQRSVQRRPMPTIALSDAQKDALQRSVAGFSVLWFESGSKRRQMALLNARNAHIRLTIPEAYAVHKAVIEWHARTSVDRLPDASLGADPLLLATMRFAMGSWRRVDMMNRFAGGTLLPRLMLDFLPGVMCSAHFALVASSAPRATGGLRRRRTRRAATVADRHAMRTADATVVYAAGVCALRARRQNIHDVGARNRGSGEHRAAPRRCAWIVERSECDIPGATRTRSSADGAGAFGQAPTRPVDRRPAAAWRGLCAYYVAERRRRSIPLSSLAAKKYG